MKKFRKFLRNIERQMSDYDRFEEEIVFDDGSSIWVMGNMDYHDTFMSNSKEELIEEDEYPNIEVAIYQAISNGHWNYNRQSGDYWYEARQEFLEEYNRELILNR